MGKSLLGRIRAASKEEMYAKKVTDCDTVRKTDLTRIVRVVLGFLCRCGQAADAAATIDYASYSNRDPAHQIRFNTRAGADAKRQQLIRYIWSDGLPTSTLPSVIKDIAFPTRDLQGIDRSLVTGIDMLDANVSGMDLHSISYLIHPANPANVDMLAIIHQGHQGGLTGGLDSTANALLLRGYSVITMWMPLKGPNEIATVHVPGKRPITLEMHGGHDRMFQDLAPLFGGETGPIFRFFVEPVVQNINYFERMTAKPAGVFMTGLSGGGWTTALAAAIDTRITIKCSRRRIVPPVPQRSNDRCLRGDSEQVDFKLYNERISTDGKNRAAAFAPIWEMYALGGYGPSRRQVMVTNLHDTCCFSGTSVTDPSLGGRGPSIQEVVAGSVTRLGEGKWDYVLDKTATSHQISAWTQNNVIVPAIGASNARSKPANSADPRRSTGSIRVACRRGPRRATTAMPAGMAALWNSTRGFSAAGPTFANPICRWPWRTGTSRGTSNC